MDIYLIRGLEKSSANQLCAACCFDCSSGFHFQWHVGDPTYSLPPPPTWLMSAYLCAICYKKHGQQMEDVVIENLKRLGGKTEVRCDCGSSDNDPTHYFWCQTQKS